MSTESTDSGDLPVSDDDAEGILGGHKQTAKKGQKATHLTGSGAPGQPFVPEPNDSSAAVMADETS